VKQGANKILLVEDDRLISEAIYEYLIDEEYLDRANEITIANSYQQAVDLLKKKKDFELIIVDILLGSGKTGLDLVEFIREEQKNYLVPIICITALSDTLPETEIMLKYDIIYYVEKNRADFLSRLGLYVFSALRAFKKDQLISKSYRDELTRLKYFISEIESLDYGLLPEVFFVHICQKLQIGTGALIKNDRIVKILDEADRVGIESAYNDFIGSDFSNSAVHEFVFIRLREFIDYYFCFSWSVGNVLNDSLTQAAILRDSIIKIVRSRNLMESLYYLTDDRAPLIYIKAEDVNVVAVKKNEQQLLKIPFKTIPLYFDDSFLLKISRSMAVNPSEVVNVNKINYRKMELTLSNGLAVPVAESRIKDVETFFEDC
jgi:CheY-like chemotaxis protein